MVDIAGSRIVYKTLAEAYNGLKIIRGNFDVVYFKDRYASPVPSGFRDILLNVKMSNGHIVELRVTLESIENIAKIEHIESYGPRRTIEKTMKVEGRTEYTPQEQAIIDGFISKYRPMYDAAWKAVLENFQSNGR
jgi:(p)ppGpp synthase/HD superfamily hydrolase